MSSDTNQIDVSKTKPLSEMSGEAVAHNNPGDQKLDSPETTIARQETLQRKLFLRLIYEEWYQLIAQSLPGGAGAVVEIGAGGGFMRDFVPDLITSDILPLPHINLTFDACEGLPFDSESLKGIVLVNTFHHLPACRAFLSEAERCLQDGGVLTMIEPWVTPFSTLIYRYLHHEPFLEREAEWHFASTGPLSGSNQALPWIVFERDREEFEATFPSLQVEMVKPIMPFRYLLSGGFSAPQLVPTGWFGFFRALERLVEPARALGAMFSLITLRKSRQIP